jgi:hypothetical protein
MLKVVSLDETNTMFAGYGAFHLHGSLHHPMNDTLGSFLLCLIEQDDSYIHC